MTDWKDSILSSGLPLEYGVRKILEDFDIKTVKEYFYERENEEGILKEFSIDCQGKYCLNNKNTKLSIEYFLECKYAHRNKNWIFYSDNIPDSEITNKFIIIDSFNTSMRVNRKIIDFLNTRQVCTKGIVVDTGNKKDSGTYEIRKGVEQLRYALVARTIEILRDKLFDSMSELTTINILVPILVTTANIWSLKSDDSIKDIEKAEKLENIAVSQEFILLLETSNLEIRRYKKSLLDNLIKKELIGDVEYLLSTIIPKLASQDFSRFIKFFLDEMPNMILVVNYNYLKNGLQNSLSFFKRGSLLIDKCSESLKDSEA